MKISRKKQDELYRAIREEIIVARGKLKLPEKDDILLMHTEIAIWKKVKDILGLQ